jgi:hypothetical protein
MLLLNCTYFLDFVGFQLWREVVDEASTRGAPVIDFTVVGADLGGSDGHDSQNEHLVEGHCFEDLRQTQLILTCYFDSVFILKKQGVPDSICRREMTLSHAYLV